MVNKAALSVLVDQALVAEPDVVGVVNFSLLKKLLHAIVNHINVDKTVTESGSGTTADNTQSSGADSSIEGSQDQAILAVQSKVAALESKVLNLENDESKRSAPQGKEAGRLTKYQNQEAGSNTESKLPDSNAMQKITELATNQDNMMRKIENIEKDLKSFEEFPTNQEILQAQSSGHDFETSLTRKSPAEDPTKVSFDSGVPLSDKESLRLPNDGSSEVNEETRGSVTPGPILSNAWTGMKQGKRIQAVEDGVERLFSLLDELLYGNKQLKLEQEKVARKCTEIDEKVDSSTEKMRSQIEGCKSDVEGCKGSVKHIADELLSKEVVIAENHDTSSNNRDTIDTFSESMARLQQRIEEREAERASAEPTAGGTIPYGDVIDGTDQAPVAGDDGETMVDGQDADEHSEAEATEGPSDVVDEMITDRTATRTPLDRSRTPHERSRTPLDRSRTPFDTDLLVKLKDDLEEQIAELAAKLGSLPSSSGASSEQLDNLKEMLLNLQVEVNALRETLANMHGMDKLGEIMKELEKLRDLKDLAANVANFGAMQKQLDELSATCVTWPSLEGALQVEEVVRVLNEKDSRSPSANLGEGFLPARKSAGSSGSGSTEDGSISSPRKDAADAPKQKMTLHATDDVEGTACGNPSADGAEVMYRIGGLLIWQALRDDISAADFDLLCQKVDYLTDFVSKLDPALSASMHAFAEENRVLISALRGEVNRVKDELALLQKMRARRASDAGSQEKDDGPSLDEYADAIAGLQARLLELNEEQQKTSGHVSNLADDTKEELYRKQSHIDALYEYIDKLQNNKLDRNDVTSYTDVKADKEALEAKVSQNMFDEFTQNLAKNLLDAVNRMDAYEQQESMLREALQKMSSDMDSKLDSENNLKKYLEDRLQQTKRSKEELADTTSLSDAELRNAAGLRKPASLFFHCISCDRPIDVNMRGSQPPVPNNFPGKRSKGPYTTYELDQIRQRLNPQSAHSNANTYDQFGANTSRPCGGSHTQTQPNKAKQQVFQSEADAQSQPDMSVRSMSVTDCVQGRDGHIYRGRYKPHQHPLSPQQLPKKPAPPNKMRNHRKDRLKSASVHSQVVAQHNEAVHRVRSAIETPAMRKPPTEGQTTPRSSLDGYTPPLSLPPIISNDVISVHGEQEQSDD